jgi:hypothetical protein
VHGVDPYSALLRFLLRHFNDTHRDGKFVHLSLVEALTIYSGVILNGRKAMKDLARTATFAV